MAFHQRFKALGLLAALDASDRAASAAYSTPNKTSRKEGIPMTNLVFLLLSIIMAMAKPAQADDLFTEPCIQAGIPKDLVLAIAKQESSLHPWALNIRGIDYMPETYKDAVHLVRRAEGAGVSYDVGIMQINNYWIKKWGIDPTELLDPETNIRRGISILAAEEWEESKMPRPVLPTTIRRDHTFRINLTSREYGVVKEYSDRAGLSLSEFGRRACLGARIPSREDHQARLQMMQAIAEIRRQGGLLKLVLSQNAGDRKEISRLLREFDPIVKRLREAVDAL